jgi:hypothetical protein
MTLYRSKGAVYAFFMRRNPTSAANPVPSKRSVAGSGTGLLGFVTDPAAEPRIKALVVLPSEAVPSTGNTPVLVE